VSLVILPAKVVPKSILIQGFLKSTSVHLLPTFIPAVTSSPSISLATTSFPVGGRTPVTAPSNIILSKKEYLSNGFGICSLVIAGVIFAGGTPAFIHP